MVYNLCIVQAVFLNSYIGIISGDMFIRSDSRTPKTTIPKLQSPPFLTVFSLLLLVLSLPPLSAQQFEETFDLKMEWQNSAPPGWIRVKAPSDEFPMANRIEREARGDFVRKGEYSIRMIPFRRKTSVQTKEIIQINSKKSYFLSSWIRMKGGGENFCMISAKFYRKNPKFISMKKEGVDEDHIEVSKYEELDQEIRGERTQATAGWEETSLYLQDIPEEATAMRIRLTFVKRDQSDFRESQAWFDDITLEERSFARVSFRDNRRIYRTGETVSFIIHPRNYLAEQKYLIEWELQDFYGKPRTIHTQHSTADRVTKTFNPVSASQKIKVNEQFIPQEPGLYRIKMSYMPADESKRASSNTGSQQSWTAGETIMVLPEDVNTFERDSWINPVIDPYQFNPLTVREVFNFFAPDQLGWVIWNRNEGAFSARDVVGDTKLREQVLEFQYILPGASHVGFLQSPPSNQETVSFTDYFLPVAENDSSFTSLKETRKKYSVIHDWVVGSGNEEELVRSSDFVEKINSIKTENKRKNPNASSSFSISHTPASKEDLKTTETAPDEQLLWLSLERPLSELKSIVKTARSVSASFQYAISLYGIRDHKLNTLEDIPNKLVRLLTFMRAQQANDIFIVPFHGEGAGIWTGNGPGNLIFALTYPTFLLSKTREIEGRFFSSPMKQNLFLGQEKSTTIVWSNKGPQKLPLPTTDNVHVYRMDGNFKDLDDHPRTDEIEVGKTPVILSGFSSDLLKTYISLRFDPKKITTQDSYQEIALKFQSYFDEEIQELEFTVHAPESFQVEKDGEAQSIVHFSKTQIDPEQELKFPFSIRVPKPTSNDLAPFDIEGKLTFKGGKQRTLEVKRFLKQDFPLDILVQQEVIGTENMLQITLQNKTKDELPLNVQLNPHSEHTLTIPGGIGQESTINIPMSQLEQGGSLLEELEIIAEETSQPYRFVSTNINIDDN